MLERVYVFADGLLDRFRGVEPPPPRAALGPIDWLLCGLCAVAAAALALWGGRIVGDTLYTEGSFNFWFQGDNPRVVANLLDPTSYQYRSTVHPLFPILTTPWVSAIPKLGFPPLGVAKALMAASGALSAALLFLTLRMIDLPRVASLVFAGVFMASAAFLHWYSVIEIAALNGLSVCLALFFLAFGQTRRNWGWVLMSMATLAMTVTNWSAGLAATIARWPVRRAVTISIVAFAAAAILSIGQKLIYPTANFFFSPTGLIREREYASANSPKWAPLDNLRSTILYSAVVPAPVIRGRTPGAFVTNQQQSPSTAGPRGLAAMIAWAVLLSLGVLGALRHKPARPVAFGLGLMLLAQIGLGLVYGDVTFLYAAGVMPMLAVLAAMSWFTPVRWLAVALAVVVVGAGGASNLAQLRTAADLAGQLLDSGGNSKWSRYAAGRFILPVPTSSRSLR